MLLGLGGAMGSAAALGGGDGTGNLYGGTMALSEAYKFAEGPDGAVWIGPDSAKANVNANAGNVYMASDTQIDYYGDGGSWTKLGVGSSSERTPSINTDDATITREFNPARTESIHFVDFPVPSSEYWSSRSSGSGFGAASKDGTLLFGTGGTQDSHGEMWFQSGAAADSRSPAEINDWSKDRTWRGYVSVNDVGELIRFGSGLLRDGEQWIGFAFDSGSLYAVSNDGSTKNRTDIIKHVSQCA
jgi:hypothetical protein